MPLQSTSGHQAEATRSKRRRIRGTHCVRRPNLVYFCNRRGRLRPLGGPYFNQNKDYPTILYHLDRELVPLRPFCPCVIAGRKAGFFLLIRRIRWGRCEHYF